MIAVRLEKEVRKLCPLLRLGTIECNVFNSHFNDELWEEIESVSEKIRNEYSLEFINERPAIAATRQAYKALGKDPNRYRPSAEALCRRIVKGMDLYRVNTLVDLINLISVTSGFSIGGFDAGKIKGSELILGIGKEHEPFVAIGRNCLNIDRLPVFRDDLGGIGTPTRDEERTKLDVETSRLLMIINDYLGGEELPQTLDYAVLLLKKYVRAVEFDVNLI
jgi:DNA/RNA-binding domain of Phe-tRNA-synthetase-like protein